MFLLTSRNGYCETNMSVFLSVVVSSNLVASNIQKELGMEKWQFDLTSLARILISCLTNLTVIYYQWSELSFRTNPLFEIAHLEGVGIIEIQNKVETSNSQRCAAAYEFICFAHVCISKLFWHKDRQVQLSRGRPFNYCLLRIVGLTARGWHAY